MKDEKQKIIDRAVFFEHVMTGVFWAIGAFVLLFLVVLTGYIIIKGIMSYYPEILSTGKNGILNQLWNTLYLVLISLVISVPLGIGAGIYIAEYARPGKLLDFLSICIEALSSIPSIVIGLFAYLVFILMTGSSWNLFAGALAVSILSLPLITTTTRDAFAALPEGYREGAFALGANHWEVIRTVLLPAAFSRILTGIIMAAGRGFGEAAALLYTAGQSTAINWNNWNIGSVTCPLNPFRPGETLSLHIWVMRTEGSLNPHSNDIASFASAVLVIISLTVSIVLRTYSSHLEKKRTGK